MKILKNRNPMTPDQQNKLNAAILRLHQDPNPLTVQSTRMQFYSVVAAVQLASRHPGFSGPTSLVAIHWAREISEALAANDPDLRLLLAMGWQQELDAPIRPPTSYLLSSDGKGITCCRCGKTSMMTALGMTADGKRLLLLGLTDGNLRRLRAGAPIVMNDTTGHACPKGWEICILHGATEEDLQAILKRSGAMKADCQIEDKRPSSN